MGKIKTQGSSGSDSIRNLKIIDLINKSNYVNNEQFIDGKSNYIKKLEKIFDVSIEPDLIVCGIDTSVLKLKNEFEKFFHLWCPTPYKCFENSTSHVVKVDLFNCECLDDIVMLKHGGFQQHIHNANGLAFDKIDLLISLSRNGKTIQFRVNHPMIVELFNDGLFHDNLQRFIFDLYKTEQDYNKYLVNLINEYLNCAFSSNPDDLNNFVLNQFIQLYT